MKKAEKSKLQLTAIKDGIASLANRLSEVEQIEERWKLNKNLTIISDYRLGRWMEMLSSIEKSLEELEHDFINILPTEDEQANYSYLEGMLDPIEGYESYSDYYPDNLLEEIKRTKKAHKNGYAF